ncbi:unnamed protein product [Phytophthora lilii]|uniref:Unnamed protein product n=1 Tax=Phytophthora lilii TaxID=2077276 RepID=A0A9W6WS70_9STRA|nr:unnamed protein product [Phytophthora lilii]
MGRGPALTGAERERIKSMWSAGESLRAITKALNRSYDTVHRVLEGPPPSKRQGAPRRLSTQQVQELVRVATAEKLSARKLKEKLGYECSERTIQRVIMKHAGHKRQREEDDSSNSEAEMENGYTPLETSGDDGDTCSQARKREEENEMLGTTATDSVVESVGRQAVADASLEAAGQSLTSTSSGSGLASTSTTKGGGQPSSQLADAATGLVDTPHTRLSTTSSQETRHLELADVIQAQNELLDGVIAQLDRQSATMEVLLRHMLNLETQRGPARASTESNNE